jgi:hypothetical protein
VGKSLPAIPLLRGIDPQGGEPVQWKIRLPWTTTSLALVVLVPHILFQSRLEAAFAYDYFMTKLQNFDHETLPFKGNYVDFEPSVAQIECWKQYYNCNISNHPAVKTRDTKPPSKTAAIENPVEEKGLRGVLKRGSDLFCGACQCTGCQ